MILVGLTGYMGSGKSVIGQIFEFLGAKLYDSDTEAKRLMTSNKRLKSNLIKAFGEEIYDSEGQLNRDILRSRVFNDENKLNQLNKIVHPEVYDDFKLFVKKNSNTNLIVFESALLLKGEFYKIFNTIIIVTTNRNLLITRIQNRNGFTTKLIKTILSRQKINISKLNINNKVIIKNDELSLLIPKVYIVFQKLKSFF